MCHLPFAMLPSSRSLDHGLQLLGAEVQPVRRTKKRLGIPFLIERPQLVTDAVEDHRDERERLAGFMTVEQGLSEQKPTQSLALMGLADSQPGKNRHRQRSAWEVPGQIRRQVAEIDLARGECKKTGNVRRGVPSPTLDRLAAEGLRYNRFHTTALCSRTRAALITGRNHHSPATGVITEGATGYDGYTCVLPRSCGTIGEVLRQNGYTTAWIGKNHNTPAWETSAARPFDLWPTGLGFEYFYGFLGGDMNQWQPAVYENTTPVEPHLGKKDYHFDTDIANRAIHWIQQQHALAPDKPFFAYYVPGAAHAPHHVPGEWIDKFKGQFDHGWDEQRRRTFENQKKLGIIPADAVLTPRPANMPA